MRVGKALLGEYTTAPFIAFQARTLCLTHTDTGDTSSIMVRCDVNGKIDSSRRDPLDWAESGCSIGPLTRFDLVRHLIPGFIGINRTWCCVEGGGGVGRFSRWGWLPSLQPVG